MSPPVSSEPLRSFSPQSPRDLVGEFTLSSTADVERAVGAARVAQREWWALGAAGRAAALRAAAGELRTGREEAAALVVQEVGKPAGEAAGEVARAISIIEYYAQACFAAIGEQFPPSLGGLLFTQRIPHGVAALITPWNFPLAIPLWKAAPALASGNGVVLKPSSDSPACGELLERVFSAHLPEHLFTVMYGGAQIARALVDSCDVVSFTGSDLVGRSVAAQAGQRAIPAQCEMGGQNAAIVFDDADPGHTAELVAGAAMGFAGQKCTATRRVIVVGANDGFVEAFVESVSALRPGAPEEPATTVGPVISETARDDVLKAIDLGVSAGGRVVAGGGRARDEGWFVTPTLIDGLAPEHSLAQEETFGPLVTLLHARDGQEAVRMTNGVRYGLVTSLHGRDLDRLLATAAAVDTGLIKVNAPTTGVDFYAPFGGEKDSSYGLREQGHAALAFYSSTRTVSIAPHGR
jgi:acyl-CoA reductase-like NAD-dependent aldehyde dehydrogenase